MTPFKTLRTNKKVKCYYCGRWVKERFLIQHLAKKHKHIHKQLQKSRVKTVLRAKPKGLTFNQLLQHTHYEKSVLTRVLKELIDSNEVLFYSTSINNKSVVRNPKGIYVYNFKNKK